MVLSTIYHSPVLLPEVIEGLQVESGKKYIDATIGGGGYSFEILKRGGIVMGIDADFDAVDYLFSTFQKKSSSKRNPYQVGRDIFIVQGNFANLSELASRFGFGNVAGVLFDLGMSSHQIKQSGRGFTFMLDEPLDMRMDKNSSIKASDIVNTYQVEELYEIFSKFAEELYSRSIAESIVRTRSVTGPILKTGQIEALIRNVFIKKFPDISESELEKMIKKSLARIFQALRIVVNNELENLRKGLEQAVHVLGYGGKIAVLSYHSLEDRIVKLAFRQMKQANILTFDSKGFIRPKLQEIRVNPKARSAKLRIAKKIYAEQ